MQAQPFHIRRAILLGGTFVVTILIFLFWISMFAFSHGPREAPKEMTEKKTESPFSLIKNNVVQLYANAGEGLQSALQK